VVLLARRVSQGQVDVDDWLGTRPWPAGAGMAVVRGGAAKLTCVANNTRVSISERPLPEPVQRGLGDLAPAVVDRQRVPAIGKLYEVSDSR